MGTKVLEFVKDYSSVFGFLTTFIFTIYAIKHQAWDVSFTAVVIILASVNFFLVYQTIMTIRRYHELDSTHSMTASVIESLKENVNKLELKIQSELCGKSEIAKIMHNFCHDYRKIICAMHCDLVDCNKTDFPSRSQSFKLFLNFMLSNIKKIFDTLTGDNCSVCIKILDEKFTVRTYLRDNISYRERSNADKYLSSYKYTENTAFKDILDDDIKESYYLCNNLQARLKEERYNNRNEKWNKYYNACLVVPIRLIFESDAKQEKSNVIGFICVDLC